MSRNTLGGILVGAMLALGWQTSMAAEAGKTAAADLSRNANASLKQLYARVPQAKSLGQKALAILVFPKVTKAGLGVGGQYGEGALLQKGKAVAYYNTAGASVGLQAGASNTDTRCSS
jgi:lipid-binding SYLF domain-containing protein